MVYSAIWLSSIGNSIDLCKGVDMFSRCVCGEYLDMQLGFEKRDYFKSWAFVRRVLCIEDVMLCNTACPFSIKVFIL